MKKLINDIFKEVDHIIFLITNVIFSIIPVGLILIGAVGILSIFGGWYFKHNYFTSDYWYILIYIFAILIGFKWDDAVIDHYPTAIARKENDKKRDENI